MQRKEASSQLFGLLPSNTDTRQNGPQSPLPQPTSEPLASYPSDRGETSTASLVDWTIYDADFFAMPWPIENDQGLQDFLQPGTHTLNGASVADIPLFPIYDQQLGNAFL